MLEALSFNVFNKDSNNSIVLAIIIISTNYNAINLGLAYVVVVRNQASVNKINNYLITFNVS